MGSGRFPLKTLVAAKHNLNSLKEKLNKDPDNNKEELKKLYLVEVKLNSSISKTKKKEILLAMDYLKLEPRRYVLHLAETKSKIDSLKTKLENSSLLYKKYSEEVDKIEKLFAKQIDIPQKERLVTVINHIQKIRKRIRRKEMNHYREKERTLNKALDPVKQKDLQKDKDTGKSQNKKQLVLNWNRYVKTIFFHIS